MPPRNMPDVVARSMNRFRSQVEAGHQEQIVAIEIENGAFEIADTTLAACDKLLARFPDAQIWCVRVGHSAVHRIAPLR